MSAQVEPAPGHAETQRERRALPLRLDLLVGGKVIVECKATTDHNPIFEVPTLTSASHKIVAEEQRRAARQALFQSTLHQLVTGARPRSGLTLCLGGPP